MARKEIATAKVATILDENQIALNKGSDGGIAVGDTVGLFRNVEIVDPDTKKSLGTVSLGKLGLRINFVTATYSVARVTDRVAATPGKPQVSLSTKTISEDPFIDVNDRTQVHVLVGERAVVSRDIKEDPPF
jgi:hypothetical protein